MKLVMTLCVRDEADIIRHTIDFHRAMGVDFFIVTDNLSVDNTKEILEEYVAHGILRYLYSDDDTHSQHKHVTNMARLAYVEHGADWVINNDADEFWYPGMHKNLKDVFATFDADIHDIYFDRSNFVPLKYYKEPFYKSMLYKQNHSINWLGKPLPGKTAHRGSADILVQQGNHKVERTDARQQPPIHSSLIEILHYTARVFNVFEESIRHGGNAYGNNTELGKNIGIVRRTLYAEYVEQGGLQDFYKREYYSRIRVWRELLNKNIVFDCRLMDFFDALYEA